MGTFNNPGLLVRVHEQTSLVVLPRIGENNADRAACAFPPHLAAFSSALNKSSTSDHLSVSFVDRPHLLIGQPYSGSGCYRGCFDLHFPDYFLFVLSARLRFRLVWPIFRLIWLSPSFFPWGFPLIVSLLCFSFFAHHCRAALHRPSPSFLVFGLCCD